MILAPCARREVESVVVNYSSHLADAGADHSEIEKAYYWVQRENKFLQYLDRALEMIEEGTFGICKSCGDKINPERLLEVPHTTSCFECKNRNLKGLGNGGITLPLNFSLPEKFGLEHLENKQN